MANPTITKEFVIGAVNKAGEIIKSGIKPTKAEDLLKKKKKDLKIDGEKKATITADGETETVIKVSKKKFKKNVPDVSQDVSDDALFKYNAMKITPKILDDFNIDNIKSKEDVAKFIELISKKYSFSFVIKSKAQKFKFNLFANLNDLSILSFDILDNSIVVLSSFL